MTVLPETFRRSLEHALTERSPTPDLSAAFPGYRRAAVLVPVLQTSGGLELFFTVRSAGLPHHAGQISFPGGRLEPGESLSDAARRETLEEVGLNVPETDLLGTLFELPSPARYLVTPVVGLIAWPQPLALRLKRRIRRRRHGGYRRRIHWWLVTYRARPRRRFANLP